MRLRGRAGGDPRREGAARPAGARSCGSRATTSRIRTGRSRTRTCRRSRASSTPPASCSRSSGAPRAAARSPAILHGHFSRELEPVLTIDPGDSVRFSVPNAGWDVGRDEPFEPRNPELDTGHALAGPIEVRGARAGQTLAVRIDEVAPGLVGRHVRRPDHRVDWELADGVGRGARPRGPAGAVPRRARDAAGRAGRPLDDPAAAVRRQHRLQGARRRDDALPADPRRRRALLRRRRPRGPGRRRGLGHGDRVPRSRRRLTLDLRDDLRSSGRLPGSTAPGSTFGFDEHLGKAAADRGRRDARPDGARARSRPRGRARASRASSSTCASPRS